jgi:hypothetical protein
VIRCAALICNNTHVSARIHAIKVHSFAYLMLTTLMRMPNGTEVRTPSKTNKRRNSPRKRQLSVRVHKHRCCPPMQSYPHDKITCDLPTVWEIGTTFREESTLTISK